MLNEDVSLMPSVLAEIERALQSYDVTVFTDYIIRTLRHHVETNEFVFSSQLMSEVNDRDRFERHLRCKFIRVMQN